MRATKISLLILFVGIALAPLLANARPVDVQTSLGVATHSLTAQYALVSDL